MYGASSILMLAVSGAVNGFTLDMSIGEFVLTHRDVKVPQRGAYYSANEGRSESWDDATKAYSSPFMLLRRHCVPAYPTKSQVRERREEWRFLW
jgi:fructose-1,6-bisphosphatase